MGQIPETSHIQYVHRCLRGEYCHLYIVTLYAVYNFNNNIKIIQGVSAFRYECTIIKSDNTEMFSTKNKHELT